MPSKPKAQNHKNTIIRQLKKIKSRDAVWRSASSVCIRKWPLILLFRPLQGDHSTTPGRHGDWEKWPCRETTRLSAITWLTTGSNLHSSADGHGASRPHYYPLYEKKNISFGTDTELISHHHMSPSLVWISQRLPKAWMCSCSVLELE